jgi:hypothetical protein
MKVCGLQKARYAYSAKARLEHGAICCHACKSISTSTVASCLLADSRVLQISSVRHDAAIVSRVTDHDLGIGTIHADVGGAPSVQTDNEISRSVGGKHMYMPSYFTAVVGHGIAAPAYMSALLSMCAGVFVFRVLPKTPQRKGSTPISLPSALMGPRSLRPLAPMGGLVMLELLSQVRSPSAALYQHLETCVRCARRAGPQSWSVSY